MSEPTPRVLKIAKILAKHTFAFGAPVPDTDERYDCGDWDKDIGDRAKAIYIKAAEEIDAYISRPEVVIELMASKEHKNG